MLWSEYAAYNRFLQFLKSISGIGSIRLDSRQQSFKINHVGVALVAVVAAEIISAVYRTGNIIQPAAFVHFLRGLVKRYKQLVKCGEVGYRKGSAL